MKRRIKEQDYRKSKIYHHRKYMSCDGTVHEWAEGKGVWIDFTDEVPYYSLTKYNNRTGKRNYKTFLKGYNNRRIRRFKGDISCGKSYKKLNEFWWEIY